MSDELLSYYEKELAFIRQLGAEFAKEHPKIAGRLGVSDETIEDPHVSRLIEAFAYIAARIQHKLDDDFSELSDALLSVLFPHYQNPIPSMSIAQFVPDREQLQGAYRIPRGTQLGTEQYQGESCVFGTAYETLLYPIDIVGAQLLGLPLSTPGAARARGARSVLRLSLKTFSPEIRFGDLGVNDLRVYLKGQPQHVHPLFEMLLKDCIEVVLARGDGDVAPVSLGRDCIQPVGFAADEELLPYPPAAFEGYRVLTEHFVFPEKFMFIDIAGLGERLPENVGEELTLYVYFNSADIELEHNIGAGSFALGCTPVVNLFPHRADPIRLDHTRDEFEVTPDIRRPAGFEVYSIDKVSVSKANGDIVEYAPFYAASQRASQQGLYWFAARRSAKLSANQRDEGTHMFVSLVDSACRPKLPDERVLNVDTMCTNRDQPVKLPYGNDQPRLQCLNEAPPCTAIRLLKKPTAVVRPPLRNFARWRLISHLNLNVLSLTGGADATEALKGILRLYDFQGSGATRALIESIAAVRSHPISAPLNMDGRTMMCRGVEIEVEIDDSRLTGASAYLFALVLEQFFAVYRSINSFTRLLVRVKGKEGYLKKCPPRAGQKILL